MRKKLFALAVSMCLALGPCSAMPVVANTGNSTQLRAQQCGNCDGMTLNNYTIYGKWYLVGQQRCKKQWNLSDDIYERTIMKRHVIKGYSCFGCGYDYIDSISTDSKILEKYENVR